MIIIMTKQKKENLPFGPQRKNKKSEKTNKYLDLTREKKM